MLFSTKLLDNKNDKISFLEKHFREHLKISTVIHR